MKKAAASTAALRNPMSMNAKNLIRFVDLVQGTPEWKEFRKGKIGSSMAASIRGIGFKTPLQLFEDVMEDRETPDNEAMRRGRDMEPVIRDWLTIPILWSSSL